MSHYRLLKSLFVFLLLYSSALGLIGRDIERALPGGVRLRVQVGRFRCFRQV